MPSENLLTQSYLQTLEREITKWQAYRGRHTDTIAAFFSWRASFVELMKTEVILSLLIHRVYK